jgi:hypothetical protein
MKTSLRNGFFAGLALTLALGVYLHRLWQPERQVELHSVHFLHEIEANDWSDAEKFIGENYADRWGQDRALLAARFRAVLPFARNLHLNVMAAAAHADANAGDWSARITVDAEPNEIAEMIKTHVNSLDTPITLKWQRVGKPWEWKLVRIDNEALEIPENPY